MPETHASDRLLETRASLQRRIQSLCAGRDMVELDALPGLVLMHIDRPSQTPCNVYEPCVAIIVQGSKQVRLGDAPLVFGTDRCVIVSVDMPVRSVLVQASPEHPYLALALRLDWRDIASLMLEVPARDGDTAPPNGPAMTTATLTWPLLDAFDRLLGLMEQPHDTATLAPLIRREIHYRLLTGEAGARLRQTATIDSQSHQIARAVANLNARFHEPLRVESLAREVGMSPSAFHRHFKALTATSPLQYQKHLRLTEARRLMLSQQLDVATAAYRVGYESASQFSREYRRLFGIPPSSDTADNRWELPPEAT